MNQNKKSVFQTLYPFIVIALSLILFILLITFINNYRELSSSYTLSVDNLYYCIDNGNYQNLYERCAYNRAAGVKETSELSELYAVADYYHNAFYYYGLQDTDNAHLSDYQKAMEESAAQAGSLSYVLPKIDALLTDAASHF
jgi:hypothetical protein